MRAWPSPGFPSFRLPAEPPALRIHDSVAGTVVDTAPEGGTARMYVCGITPYDATHIGHAATFVAFDLLNRAWRLVGQQVRYVQNVTDVDDPLLARAAATGEDWAELAERETQVLRDDMAALRVLPPDAFVGAVESIPLITRFVSRLLQTGAVYEVDSDLYFSVHADPAFGEVSGLNRAAMLAILPERGGDPDRPGKKDPLDCLLWQAERPGEPAWESPFGRGRPGWHVECAAISLDRLGPGFDVSGGGSDLLFPHHEMSAAEAHVADPGAPYTRAFMHAGMVGLDGEKMSKSKGNLVFVSHLRADGADPMAIRMALLGHHYRSDWDWTGDELAHANVRLDEWRQAVARPAGAATEPVVREVALALCDDLDAPAAVDAVRRWADATLAGADAEPAAGEVVRTLVDAALGIAL